jgi:CRP/FNR family cyclic AMP-dependent transcriptional regulator
MNTREPMLTNVTARTLAAFDLFQGIDAGERQALEQRCSWRWWPAGAMIVARDTISVSVHFVVAGRCRVVSRAPAGRREVVLDEIGAGGFFGEMAAIDGEPRSAAVIALERTQIAELDGEAFQQFLAAHPLAAVRVMRRLTEVIRQADSIITDISGLNAQARVYADLLRRARTGGGLPANVGAIAPVPRHNDIAACAGTVRETVVRVLSSLARRQLLRRERERLLLTDVAALTRMAAVPAS